MTGTFLAAWIKLRRPALLLGSLGVVAALTVLFTWLIVANASDAPTASGDLRRDGPGAGVTLASLARPEGLLVGATGGATFIGVVVLCVAAAAFAGEYSTGTLRNLLIRQPGRLRVLLGTWAATAAFAVAVVLVAALAGGLTSLVATAGRGVDTSAWFTADGLGETARSLGELSLAGIGFATLGAALGVLLRTPVLAVALGLAWLLPVETILIGTVDGADRWLPGQLLAAVGSGGTATVTMAAAVATAGAYLAVSAAAASTAFLRRDVAA